jgi:Kef-type K+ transport system membrane component KefB
VDDATAWLLLAFASGLAAARTTGAWSLALGFAAYLAVMLLVVRPLAAAWAARRNDEAGPLGLGALSAVFVALLLSALATEWLGIHALFGAFLLGVLLPHEGRLAEQLRARMEDLVLVLLLPAFFAFTGMRTQVGLVSGLQDWMLAGLILLAATAGKFGGTALAARACGLPWRDASALGVLMNTRGLMELVALNVGLDLGVITPALFTMLVLMALATTFATAPALRLVLGPDGFGDPA